MYACRTIALTKAEAAVLSLVDSGLSNQQIAAVLAISIGTVKCHLHRVFDKLEARNRTEASAKAREQGALLPVPIQAGVERRFMSR
jgi:ATP/maltotriose-dependent transcriptional regulator MalT